MHSGDRKSTRLNSSHSQISYAVFCLKKKKNRTIDSRGTVGGGRRDSAGGVLQPAGRRTPPHRGLDGRSRRVSPGLYFFFFLNNRAPPEFSPFPPPAPFPS